MWQIEVGRQGVAESSWEVWCDKEKLESLVEAERSLVEAEGSRKSGMSERC